MKKLILIMGLALLLGGCALPDIEYLEYTTDAFIADVEGEINGFIFTARIMVGVPTGEDAPPRDIEMTFTGPETMSGVMIKRSGGLLTLSSGGVRLSCEGAGGWLAAAELLIPSGRINDIKIIDDSRGARLARVEMSLPDAAPITLTIDCDTGFPVNIKSENTEIRIASFGDCRK